MKLLNKVLVLFVTTLLVVTPTLGVFAQTPDSAATKTRQRFADKGREQEKSVEADGSAKTNTPDKNAKKGTTGSDGDH